MADKGTNSLAQQESILKAQRDALVSQEQETAGYVVASVAVSRIVSSQAGPLFQAQPPLAERDSAAGRQYRAALATAAAAAHNRVEQSQLADAHLRASQATQARINARPPATTPGFGATVAANEMEQLRDFQLATSRQFRQQAQASADAEFNARALASSIASKTWNLPVPNFKNAALTIIAGRAGLSALNNGIAYVKANVALAENEIALDAVEAAQGIPVAQRTPTYSLFNPVVTANRILGWGVQQGGATVKVSTHALVALRAVLGNFGLPPDVHSPLPLMDVGGEEEVLVLDP